MNNETSSTGSTGKWYKRAWKYLSKALWYFLLMLTAGIAIIMFGKSAVNIVGGTLAFAFGFLAVVFAVIILMAVIVRWTTGTRKQGPIVTDATGISRLRGMFSSLWSTRKDIGSSVEPRVIGLVLWILVLISFGALFPEAFTAWWGHQNIFWISQLVAVLLIFFLPAKYSATLFGLVIAVLLWSAVSTTFGPPPSSEEVAQRGVAPRASIKTLVARDFSPSEEFIFPDGLKETDYKCEENVVLRVSFKARGTTYTDEVTCGPEIQSSIIDTEKHPELKKVTVVSNYKVRVAAPMEKGKQVRVKLIMTHL